MSSGFGPNEEEAVAAELVELLDVPRPRGYRNAVAAMSAEGCRRLIEYVARRLPADGYSAADTAWALICRAARTADVLDSEPRPLVAAKYLLALGSKEEAESDTGKTWGELLKKPPTSTHSTSLHESKKLRQKVAAEAGRYGHEKSGRAYNNVARETEHGAKNLESIAQALFSEIRNLADSPDFETLAVAAQTTTDVNPRPVAMPVVKPEQSKAPGDKARATRGLNALMLKLPRLRIWLVTLLLLALAASAAVVVFQTWASTDEPSAYTAVDVDEPGVSVAEQSSGPPRDEIAAEARTSEVVLNSIFNNPDYGDERNFVQVKLADEPDSGYADTIATTAGQNYTIRIYLHNNASPSSTDSVATGARLQVLAPGVIRGSGAISVLLSADNATPNTVWDSVVMVTPLPDDAVALRYVASSATLYLGEADGVKLGDDLFREGVPLGCGELNGELPPSDDCSGYVTFDLRVVQPNFTIELAARIKGSDSEFSSNLAVSPGDVVEVRMIYTNTGSTQQDNVTLRVMDLPSELRYVSESTVIAHSKTEGVYEPSVDGITTVGLDVGSFAPTANFYLKVLLQVDEEASGSADARWLTLSPFVRVTASGSYKEASLNLIIIE